MPAPLRLKRRAEFLRAAARGTKAAMPGLVLQALPRDDEAGPVRLGFTVTKRVGNAVVRNRVRRRLREAARAALARQALTGAALSGVDLVLIGRDGTTARPFADLVADVERAIDRAMPGRRPPAPRTAP